jgi:ribosomal protein S18 acetylase RimI-like enzyme
MARLFTDRVCNAYLLDVWTLSAYRRLGIGSALIRQLIGRSPLGSTSACNRRG